MWIVVGISYATGRFFEIPGAYPMKFPLANRVAELMRLQNTMSDITFEVKEVEHGE